MSSTPPDPLPVSSLQRRGRCVGLCLCLSLLLVGAVACRLGQPQLQQQAEQQRRQRQLARQAAQRCINRRDSLRSRLGQLGESERELLRLRGATPPLSRPRPIWDEAKERRYSPADQEIDRQDYERELQLWRDSQAASQASWRRIQARRLAAAQQRLNRRAAELRRQHPDLFSGPISIEVDPAALERLNRCPPLPS
jgi:hypothetical protein